MKVKTHLKAGPDSKVGDKTLTLDEDGFIQEPEQWDEDVAKASVKAK